MLNQSCGACAIEQNLPLEDRKKLAKEIIADQVYKCPFCEIYFGLFHSQYASNHDRTELPLVEKNNAPKKTEEKIEKPKLNQEKSVTVVQTSLF